MAYEPGGGSGEPYNRYEDLNYDPRYSIQDWIRNMMQQGNVGVAPPMGTSMPDFAQDRMYGRTPPSDLDIQPQGPQTGPYDDNTQGNPDEAIRQQLAGDVVKFPQKPVLEPGMIHDPYMDAWIDQQWNDLSRRMSQPSGQIIPLPRIPRR